MNIPDRVGTTEKREAAYEIKFVVPLAIGEQALTWARRQLSPDPHVDASHGDGYQVNSLYFDTPQLDVYQRTGSYGKAKYRVRRYGQETGVFLERKLKARGLVSKRRTRVADDDVVRLALVDPPEQWPGSWFHRRLGLRRLRPQCQIKYQRVARVGMTPEGLVRFTLDREVCSFLSGEYEVHEDAAWRPLLHDQCILELKFRQELPALFKSLTELLSLSPQPVSKYRLTIQAFGLDPKPPATVQPPPSTNGHLAPEGLIETRPCLIESRGLERA